jgi:hypothetical protein
MASRRAINIATPMVRRKRLDPLPSKEMMPLIESPRMKISNARAVIKASAAPNLSVRREQQFMVAHKVYFMFETHILVSVPPPTRQSFAVAAADGAAGRGEMGRRLAGSTSLT